MLREIQLKNYAIIDHLSLTFSEGLCVITGETGAGKSILVEALSLILGGRSDSESIRQETDEAILEACFDPVLTEKLTPDSPEPDSLIIKRVLSPSKSRAYINGSLANISALKEVGVLLAEIHGQHDHYLLTDPARQLSLLDAYAKLLDQRERYHAHYQKRSDLLKEIAALKKELGNEGRQGELLRHQLSEIQQANLQPDEDTALEQEEHQLKNWESILSSLEAGQAALSEEGGVLSQIKSIERHLRNLDQMTKDANPEIDLLSTAEIQLKELALLLRDRMSRVSHDPERLAAVTERLYLIQKLKKRYGSSIEAILKFKDQIEEELTALSEGEARLHQIEQSIEALASTLAKDADALSLARKGAVGRFEKKVKEELPELGMEKTRFAIAIQQKPLSEDGIDAIEFQVALPGENLKPIGKVASGGELSRLMLALKVALTDVDPTPTLVFDEVDAGIGGAVAERVGRRLARLAKKHQVFCVTHLPQVARFADHHYLVEKKFSDKRVVISVKKLADKERVSELARMLGGVEITPATRRHAKELFTASE